MKITYSDFYNEIEMGNHPWAIKKYKNILKGLLDNSKITEDGIIKVSWADEEDILRVHSLSYLKKLQSGKLSPEEERLSELPLSENPLGLYQLFSTFAEGTIKACEYAMQDGVCVHLGGGMHHSYSQYGTGFCMINDLAVAARASQHYSSVENIIIVDCDLHQGDGTANIFKDDKSVFTFPIHQKNLFPYWKQKSNLDIELKNETEDDEYPELQVIEQLRFPFFYPEYYSTSSKVNS
ncbi:MAG: hypothetical protein U9O87_08785 [Verrucomicrobiota bacterium]|nr:hypothetical protein [Verrucomicrobiota bacterium]